MKLANHGDWSRLAKSLGALAQAIADQPRSRKRKTNHAGHFVATVFTGGLWAPVWIWQTISHKL